MPVDETLTKINALAATAEEALVNLWNDLEAEFKQDPDLKDTDFTAWALVNVNRKILKIALDKKLAGEIASLGHRFLTRYANVLEALDVSLGLLLQLFGSKVIGSRACNASFIELCKACPDLRIQELHNAWTAQPTGIGSRRIADVTRFQRAVKSRALSSSRPQQPFPFISWDAVLTYALNQLMTASAPTYRSRRRRPTPGK